VMVVDRDREAPRSRSRPRKKIKMLKCMAIDEGGTLR
jgi:hypothetical protein